MGFSKIKYRSEIYNCAVFKREIEDYEIFSDGKVIVYKYMSESFSKIGKKEIYEKLESHVDLKKVERLLLEALERMSLLASEEKIIEFTDDMDETLFIDGIGFKVELSRPFIPGILYNILDELKFKKVK